MKTKLTEIKAADLVTKELVNAFTNLVDQLSGMRKVINKEIINNNVMNSGSNSESIYPKNYYK